MVPSNNGFWIVFIDFWLWFHYGGSSANHRGIGDMFKRGVAGFKRAVKGGGADTPRQVDVPRDDLLGGDLERVKSDDSNQVWLIFLKNGMKINPHFDWLLHVKDVATLENEYYLQEDENEARAEIVPGIYHQLRKKLPIWKKMVKEITVWFIIDENMNKIMEKTLIFNEHQKSRKWKMVNLGFC